MAPADILLMAQRSLAVAMRFSANARAGDITETFFHRAVRVETGGTGVHLPAFREATQADLFAGADNMVLLAFCGCALTTGEVLKDVFGPSDPNSTRADLGLREMIRLLRNAFAHGPWGPRWDIAPPHRKVFRIVLGATSYDFDARALDGQPVKPEDIGGMERFVQILAHCERMVRAQASAP